MIKLIRGLYMIIINKSDISKHTIYTTQLKISQKSMAKVLDKEVMYDKYYYRSLGEKLYI